jgi:hypothetical protein
MIRTYTPSLSRAIKTQYLTPAAGYLLGYFAVEIIGLFRSSNLTGFDWVAFLLFWLADAGLRALAHGIRAERYTLQVTDTSISGAILVGRAEPILFDEIDYQKTFKTGPFANWLKNHRVFSLQGDQIIIPEALFEPEQVAEIWKTLEQAKQKRFNCWQQIQQQG